MDAGSPRQHDLVVFKGKLQRDEHPQQVQGEQPFACPPRCQDDKPDRIQGKQRHEGQKDVLQDLHKGLMVCRLIRRLLS